MSAPPHAMRRHPVTPHEEGGGDALSAGWQAAVDPAQGRVFYYKRSSGEKSWIRPGVYDAPSAAASVSSGNGNSSQLPTVLRQRAAESARQAAGRSEAAGAWTGVPDGEGGSNARRAQIEEELAQLEASRVSTAHSAALHSLVQCSFAPPGTHYPARLLPVEGSVGLDGFR